MIVSTFFSTLANVQDGWFSFMAALVMNSFLITGIVCLNGLCANCAELVENLHLAMIGGVGSNELELNSLSTEPSYSGLSVTSVLGKGDEDSV